MAERDPGAVTAESSAEVSTAGGAGTGAERIADAFEGARTEGRAALMPYLMGGYPDLEASAAVAEAYVEAGADLVELGVPYSDPLADGPVIHAAATEALRAGVTLDEVLGVCARVADRVPVVPMVYANMVHQRGPEAFAASLAEAGAAGAIVPDLPLEESGPLREALSDRGLALVPLIAPTTPPERRSRICAAAAGFVYVVSLTGVTGERDSLPDGLADLIASVRTEASVPAAVGFGVASPEQAARVGQIADGVIVGSRLVRSVGEAGGKEAEAVGALVAALRSALEA